MILEKDLTISEISLALLNIQDQLDKIKVIVDTAARENTDIQTRIKKTEEQIRLYNINEMKKHGDTPEQITDWYWNNYHHTAILVITPNGDHPVCFAEWENGRKKQNKDVELSSYKDFIYRVITKGGYVDTIPF